MRYLMLVCVDSTPVPADAKAPDIEEWVKEYDAKGVRLLGDRIRPEADATTVRVRNGELLVTDGPYVETKELIAGFDVLECADLDEAIEVAAKHEMAWRGVIELRPFWTE
ncbi:MAG TPA: YciI family protein [Mycobacteriales bacterium]|nr:YciI family protein [Mycobacteriales bacterium]